MSKPFIKNLLEGSNHPESGKIVFDSSDHIRFQNGKDVSGHNYNCQRRLVIENNIEGGVGYTVTIYNMDGLHPLWQSNIQMAPKRMKIINTEGNIIELRGYGFDENALGMGAPLGAASFENYGIALMIEKDEVVRAQLNMFDRNISIVYLQ